MRNEKLEELKKYLEELKVLKKEIDNSKPEFLSAVRYNCTLNNGVVIPREKLIKGGNDGSAVIVVPVTMEGEVLTVIEPRVFTEKGVSVGFPAGYIEQNEAPHLAALRELREETGYVPKTITYLDGFYQDEGVSSAFNSILLAVNAKREFPQLLDKDECVRYMTFNDEELMELEQMGYINSSNTKLALVRYLDYKKKKGK